MVRCEKVEFIIDQEIVWKIMANFLLVIFGVFLCGKLSIFLGFSIFTHFDVSYRWNVALEAGEHCYEGEHTRDQKRYPTRDRVQAQPEAKPWEHHDQRRRCKRLDQVMTNLSLESKKHDQAWEVAWNVEKTREFSLILSFFIYLIRNRLTREKKFLPISA